MDLSRQQVLDRLAELELEWGDEDDAGTLVDLLLEVFSPMMAWTWLCFWWAPLGGLPLEVLEQGRGRDVFIEARRLVRERVV